jgi:uncharacterized coiled-coil DUF342 family protein
MKMSKGTSIMSTAEIASFFDEIRDQRDEANKRAAQLRAERDEAWQELREIRTAINADDNESTADEARSMARKLEQAQRFIRSLMVCVDRRDGTISNGTRIDVHKAERIIGDEVQE